MRTHVRICVLFAAKNSGIPRIAELVEGAVKRLHFLVRTVCAHKLFKSLHADFGILLFEEAERLALRFLVAVEVVLCDLPSYLGKPACLFGGQLSKSGILLEKSSYDFVSHKNTSFALASSFLMVAGC